MFKILLKPEILDFLGFALILIFQVHLNNDFRRNDILESIGTLVLTFFLSSHLNNSNFIVTTEFTILVFFHAVR